MIATGRPGLRILEAGPCTTVQDLGRPGLGWIGVGTSGAADRGALRLANRILGNDEGAAALETTYGGLAAQALRPLLLAVTGAPAAVRVDARAEGLNCQLYLRAGATLRLGTATAGVRGYLAVRGGIDVAPVLGSRSTDLLSGLGPPILKPGAVLPVGDSAGPCPALDVAPVAATPTGELELGLMLGPRHDWFEEVAISRLLTEPFEVTTDSNRVGIRLRGPELPRRRGGELPSEGTMLGSLQVPTHGRATLFLADHPTTGGYPVIAVVLSADVDRAAQARPGQRIRFRLTRDRALGRVPASHA
jgi:biotin-dependent carboxylase-like uncharacterized protein